MLLAPPAAMGTSTCSRDGSFSGSTGSASPTNCYDGPNTTEFSRSFSANCQEVPINRRTKRHQTMEFFEMCTELITTLAR